MLNMPSYTPSFFKYKKWHLKCLCKICNYKGSLPLTCLSANIHTLQNMTTSRELDLRAFPSRQGSQINLAFISSAKLTLMKFQVCYILFLPIFPLPKYTVQSGRQQDKSISEVDILLKSISVFLSGSHEC